MAEASTSVDTLVRKESRRATARRLFQRYLPWILIIAFFVLWQVGQTITDYPPEFIVPRPSDVLGYTVENAGFLLKHLSVTLLEAVAGFLLGTSAAIALAIVSVYNSQLERVIMPFALALRSIPLIAITPVLILLLGLGWQSKVAVATIVVFFPTLVNMIVGLRSVDARLLELLHVLDANWRQELMRVRLPSSAPSFFAALKIAVPSSILGAAVAEWINASAGIGYLIILATYQFDPVMLYATMLVTTVVSGLAYYAVVKLEVMLLPWRQHVTRS
ncbi:MAG TPA: ABC transporter permease [Candidatus Binatia bacterium]|nr:ABC transporter permease [Candidatus Binatia bacterium]